MVAALYDASRKLPKILRKFPPQLKLLCLQGTGDKTVDFHAPLKLYESPVKLDLLYLCGWSHYIPKHSGADKLLGLVITWVEKVTLTGKEVRVRLFILPILLPIHSYPSDSSAVQDHSSPH